MVLFIVMIIVLQMDYTSLNQSFNYEKLHRFGLGRRIIFKPKNFGYAYPEDLPTETSAPYIRSPYRSIYQGVRYNGDRRVYNKRFEYPPRPKGHRLFCDGMFDCTLSHIAIETNGSIPIIFRGGVGYKYFRVIIRARPGEELSGRIRAYCAKQISKDKK